MAFHDYHLTGKWRVLGQITEVYDLIATMEDYPAWWPAAFTHVLEIQPGDAAGIDKVDRFESRAWLPYLLRWHANVVSAERPRAFSFEAWGDLEGTGSWQFEQNGAWCDVTFDWQLRANKPFVRWLSPLLRPFFAANFRSLLDKGEASLRLELARRHAPDPAARQRLPAPPPATSMPAAPLVLGLGAVAAFILWRGTRHRSRRMTQKAIA